MRSVNGEGEQLKDSFGEGVGVGGNSSTSRQSGIVGPPASSPADPTSPRSTAAR